MTPRFQHARPWDYIAFETTTQRLYLYHREKGLQVFDPATQKVVGVIGDTIAAAEMPRRSPRW